MISSMFEAALRSLLLALAVWAGLRIFRVRNVLAQKAAWGLVLAAALFMPLLAPLAGRLRVLPVSAAVVLPAHPLSLLASIWPRQGASGPDLEQPRATTTISEAVQVSEPTPEFTRASDPAFAPATSSQSSMISDVYKGAPAAAPSQQLSQMPHRWTDSIADFAWALYLIVTAALLGRLFYGLVSAILLWMGAETVELNHVPGLPASLHVRSTRALSSPVTIGSAVVLPADYTGWDTEKLRVVLAHERSHIRQGDFYLQLLAGMYTALFWFSPLGWWLRSKLSDLAETISDRAGLEQAANCSSYAQLLMEFAAAPRPTLIGVAMARKGSLSRRIEYLLNDSSFRQAFADGRRRVLVAVLLVPVALFVATALIRVKAAEQSPKSTAPIAQSAPTSQPEPSANPAPSAQPEQPISGQAKPQPEAIQATAPDADEPGPPTQIVAPVPPNIQVTSLPSGEQVIVVPKIDTRVTVPPMTIRIPDTARLYALAQKAAEAYSFRYGSNGDPYGIIRGNGEHVQFSGDLSSAEVDKIRKHAHGDSLWFKHDGKYYFVDDPAIVKSIEAQYIRMEELNKQQEALGRKQGELGKQQEALGRRQEQASVPTPDVSKEMAQLNASMAKLQAKMGKTITQEELAELQGNLAELQGRLGEIEGEIGARQGELGSQQGKLGEQQGKLGAEEGRLGAEQGRRAMETDRTVKSIIDQSLQNGKAHPVD
jgi:beta-lactamase regulating signal transducer with metallopeptidase domain